MSKSSKGLQLGMFRDSGKSQVVTIRLPMEVIEKINSAIVASNSTSHTVGVYCKRVIIRHAFRHDSVETRRRLEESIDY